MNRTRIAGAVVAALVAGVVAGNVTSGFAATTTTTATGTGMRLGATMQAAGGRLADVVAKLTGLSATDVSEKRTAGQSFADIAASKGVDSNKVVSSALGIRKDVLDAKVKDGSITQEQADAAIDRMTTRLNDRVKSTDGSCTGTGSAGRGGGMGGGKGGGQGRGQGGGQGGGGTCTVQ